MMPTDAFRRNAGIGNRRRSLSGVQRAWRPRTATVPVLEKSAPLQTSRQVRYGEVSVKTREAQLPARAFTAHPGPAGRSRV